MYTKEDLLKSLPEDMHGFKMHFVGIKGTGMVALVEICHSRGAVITGSDVTERFYTDDVLDKLGIKALPFNGANIASVEPDVVVYSSAYKLDINPDLIEAVKTGIPCLLYTEALGAVSAVAYSAGICGVHGKTTTTGLSGTVAKGLNLPAQILAGSVITSFGNSCTLDNGHEYFIAETCEYQRHFMSFHPQKIVLTSVESDHEDYYPTYEDIRQAFIDYLCLLPEGGEVIYCADDKGACETVALALEQRPDIIGVPYGVTAEGDYAVSFGKVESGVQTFRLNGFNADFALRIPGKHTVLDSAAALALNFQLLKTARGVAPETDAAAVITADDVQNAKNALLSFAGAKRRSEIVGEAECAVKGAAAGSASKNSVLVIDDYGHHPTAVATTLEGYKAFYEDRVIIADFMSHTYTRTAALLEEFASSFTAADEVILHKIYPSAREVYSGGVNGKILYARTCAHHQNVQYYEEILDAKDYVLERLSQPLPEGKKGYLLVTMGAGDNWKLGRAVLDALAAR